jgi:predicted enzyme related to lactoylglutathione lyase
MATSTGRFVWYDLMTTDMEAAEAFYRDVVRWQARDSGMPGPSRYTLFSTGGRDVAGLMIIPDEVKARGARPAWNGYIGVDDVDRATDEVKEKGGAIHYPATDIPGVGRFAVLTDPQGAFFYLFEPDAGQEDGQPAMDAPGHVGWRELMTSDLDAAFAFYAAQFGFTKAEAIDMGPMGTYQLFATGGPDAAGGMMKRPPEVPMSFWLFYFNVDGLDAAIGRVTTGGGQVLNGPMEVPGGAWIAQCSDPQGAMFALVSQNR